MEQNESKIISTISNKGGVGKTLFSIETANILGKSGKKVLLIDTDMNTGDISIKLNIRAAKTLLDFFEKKATDLKDMVIQAYNFDLLPGAGGNFKFANINYVQKLKFINAFQEIAKSYDYTILDLGAGIDRVTIDFALTADYTVILTTPEDIQTGYGCAKAVAERLNELETKMSEKDRDYMRAHQFKPFFVFNKSDYEIASRIFSGVRRAAEVTKDQSGIQIKPRFLGSIQADYKLVNRSYAQYHTPISELYPSGDLCRSFKQIAHNFLEMNGTPDLKFYKKKRPLEKIMSFFKNEKDPVTEIQY